MTTPNVTAVGTWSGTVSHDDALDPFEVSFSEDGSVALRTPTSVGGGHWADGDGVFFSYFLHEVCTEGPRRGAHVRIEVAAHLAPEEYGGVGLAHVVVEGNIVNRTEASFTAERVSEAPAAWHDENYEAVAAAAAPPVVIARRLRARGFVGEVLGPDDPQYDERRRGWNLSWDQRPRVIVCPASPADVARALAFADAGNVAVAVQATGHGPSAPMRDCILIDTSRLDTCSFDGEIAGIGAGTRWRDVLPVLATDGKAGLCGSSPDVGVVGFLSGGGLPVLCRSHGLAADTVVGLEVATPAGALLRCSATEHPGLFWASLGGRGNVGLITSVDLRAIPDPHLYGGVLQFAEDRVDDALRGWFRWLPGVPDEMNSSIVVLRFPDLPQTPPEKRDRFFVHVRVAYTGDHADGARLLEPLRALGTEVDTVRPLPYTEIGSIYQDPPRPTPARIRTAVAGAFPDEAVESLVRAAGARADLPFGGVEFRHLGGRLADTSPAPVSHRGAGFLVFVTNPAFDDRLDEVVKAQEHIFTELAPWLSEHTLPGFLFTFDTDDVVRRAYAEADWARLQAAKAAYDPKNTLRANHNIAPAPQMAGR